MVLVGLAACGTPPPPRPWLRYQQDGPTTWGTNPNGLHAGNLHGAEVTIDLGRQQTRVQITIDNRGPAPVEFRIGPEGGAPRVAIGEVLLRQLDAPSGLGGPPIQPYTAQQPLAVESGWRATFYLDSPLGREPVLGQYFVLSVEARSAAGANERRTLPLRAIHAGTMPADGSGG
ncbi:MAG: hypothetical protein JNL08_16575 [Planctomycetes bacterium]|nr:hypothetical protein [Planctomycetota bacterium]